MPFPIYDAQSCMKASAEKTEVLAKKMHELIQRNVTPSKYCHSSAYRLQHSFMLNSTQHIIDKLIVQTQDVIKALTNEMCDSNNDITYATSIISDADNSKQVGLVN